MQYSNESVEVTEERNVARGVLVGVLMAGLIWCLFALVLPAVAHADEGDTDTYVAFANGDQFMVVTPHRVVVSSTLRHCPLEDGGPRLRRFGPCTWNIGLDGNGRGLAYVLFLYHGERHADYFWNHDPEVNGWHFLDESADCVVRHVASGHGHLKCANGERATYPVTGDPA